MAYLTICFFSGVAGALVGKMKGSSIVLWFLISFVVPFIGPLAALLYRRESDELRRQCPTCGKVTKIYDAICTRCGTELDFPEVAIVPESGRRRG